MDITKEELEIYLDVMDKLEEHSKIKTSNYDIYIKILLGILVVGFLIFIYYSNKDNKKQIEKKTDDKNIYSNINNNSCSGSYCKSFF